MAHVLADNLRSSILNDAILGKLTEHNYNDRSVFDLIMNAKRACSKATIDGHKVKKKEINLNYCFEEDIPENWSYIKLGEICIIGRGGSPRPINAYLTNDPNGINWIKIGDTEKGGKYIHQTKEKIIKEGMKKSRFVHEGDFLLTNSMSFGRPYILKTNGCIHDGWLVISQPREVFIQDYLYYLLSSNYAYNQFTDKVSGAVVKNLNSDKVADSIFPVPPIEEQARIVAKVDELMAKIDEYEKLEKKLTELKEKFPGEMKESISLYAYQGKMSKQDDEDTPVYKLLNEIRNKKEDKIKSKILKEEKELPEITENDIPYEIPENWEWVRFGNYCEKVTDQVASGSFKSLRENVCSLKTKDYALMVKTADFSNNFTQDLTYTDKHGYEFLSNSNLFGGELILSNIGSIGKVFIVPKMNVPMTLAPNSIMLRFTDDKLRDYVYRYLTSPVGYNQLLSITSGTAMKKFNKTDFKKLLIPIPPIEEQQRIVDKLDELLPMCDELINLC